MPRRPVLLPLVLLASACAGRLGPAVDAFDDARYPEARRELRRLEPELPDMGARELARYALHRGLTELALGDAPRAHGWLALARQVAAHDPDALSPREHSRLGAGWRALGLMPGEERPAPRAAAR